MTPASARVVVAAGSAHFGPTRNRAHNVSCPPPLTERSFPLRVSTETRSRCDAFVGVVQGGATRREAPNRALRRRHPRTGRVGHRGRAGPLAPPADGGRPPLPRRRRGHRAADLLR